MNRPSKSRLIAFLTWKVDEYFTAVSGILKLEIRGIKGDELVIKYDLSDIIVRESAVGEGLPEIPDTSVIQGEKGDNGLSAYEIWLSLGNSGTEEDFIASLKGEKGYRGFQGKKGDYYFSLKVNTTNPTFTIRKIFVVSG